nr:hypothetical protein [Anaerolineae bacterium]
YMDCMGVHFNAGATSPDATTGHPADSNGHYTWYFWPTYNLYTETFPNTPLCYTELGIVSPEGYGAAPPDFWWSGDTSVAEHAEWLGRAARLLRDSGKVRLMIVFNVDLTSYTADPQAGYAILRADGTCPACEKLNQAMH